MGIPVAILSIAAMASAGHPATWSFSAEPVEGGAYRLMLTAQLQPGWHIYHFELPSDEGPLPTELRLEPSDAFRVKGGWDAPEPVEEYDPNFGVTVRHHSGTVRFTTLLEPRLKGPFEVRGTVEYMLCDDRTCLPPTVVPFRVACGANTRP
jgi:thiol:disulfide interchange protein DsbD